MSPPSPPERAAIWIVIPCKPLAEAKGRLAPSLGAARRAAFARAMLEDVLAAALAARGVAGVLVVSRDAEICAIARSYDAEVMAEDMPGLDGAVAAAARRLSGSRAAGMIVVPADVPLASAEEIERTAAALATRAETGSAVVLVSSRDGTGTNALGLAPCDAIASAYGPSSFQRHRDAARDAGIEPIVLDLPSLAFDIDTPADLADFAGRPALTRARAAFATPAAFGVHDARRILAAAIAGRRPTHAEAMSLAAYDDLGSLMATAAQIRDAGFGGCVTYSRKVFIPLTRLCRDVCHYCTFAQSPQPGERAYLTVDEAIAIARAGAAAGCKEALFTLGDQPERRYRIAQEELAALGFASTLGYLAHVAKRVFEETGLFPHLNPGVMARDDVRRLRAVSVSQGLMLESASERLCRKGGPHFGSPDKRPDVRLATIRAAGEAQVPFTSGILIGIGETRAERIEALLALRDLHDRYGHMQEIIVQNFRAKAGTRMAGASEPTIDDHLWTVALARILFGMRMSIQAPPNLSPGLLGRLVAAGIDDWGGVSPVTHDHVNPEAPWPHLGDLAQATAAAGKTLVERLAVYPAFAREPSRWLGPTIGTAVMRATDAEGFVRDGPWLAGAPTPIPAPAPLPTVPAANDLTRILHRARDGKDLSEAEVVRLFQARGAEVPVVLAAADTLRAEVVGDAVTYVVNRNINYTNVCYFRCAFCAFSKGKLSANLRGRPYGLARDEIARRVREAWDRGATEVCLQGGIHPEYTGRTYLDIVHAVKEAAPEIHVHAFTPLEVSQGARTLGISVEAFLAELKTAGLGSLPGTAAEILDDEVRAAICPDKITTAEWLAVMDVAHSLGLRSTATIMFGHLERPVHWARHLLRLRALQVRTGGFTEIVPLPFVHMEAPLYLKGRARKGPTFREAMLMQAIARLALHPHFANIQASWVKLGPEGAKGALAAGANDLGGTLMNESITRAAGAAHGQETAPERMEVLIRSAGRVPVQRTTLYGRPTAERRAVSFAAAPLAEPVNTPARKYEREGRSGIAAE